MASKAVDLPVDFDPARVGDRAVFNDKQIRALLFGKQFAFKAGYTYVLPRQWIHVRDLEQAYNGFTQSKCVFILVFDPDGRLYNMIQPSFGSLNATYYSEYSSDDTFIVSAVKNAQGLCRATTGTNQISLFERGEIPLNDEKEHVCITKDIAFIATGRHQVLVPQFERLPLGYSMKTKTLDGQLILDLGIQTVYKFEQLDEIPKYTPQDTPNWQLLKKFQKDLPE